MSLLGEVAAILEGAGIPFAVIGAAAMARLGVARSTLDLDLLVCDRSILRRKLWRPLEQGGATVEIRHGDISDPLAGAVAVEREDERPVDVLVGDAPWQERIIREATPATIAGMELPVADATGLILLKLYAGGPRDRWDIQQILASAPDPNDLSTAVASHLDQLPPRCRRSWEELASSFT